MRVIGRNYMLILRAKWLLTLHHELFHSVRLYFVNPNKVNRACLEALTDLPNIAKAGAGDLRMLGYTQPSELVGQCPFEMYDRLCALTATRHDPCVIDVFISVTRFMAGDDPQPWWRYTAERKRAVQDGRIAIAQSEQFNETTE